MKNRFNKDFFIGNRRRLAEKLPGHLIVIPAHCLLQSSVDEHYTFRQDSNFWYLCGINEPDLVLIIDTDTGKSTLLLPELNEYQRDWDGDHDEAELKNRSGVNETAKAATLEKLIGSALDAGQKIGYLPAPAERIEPFGFYANPSRKLLESKLREYCSDEDLQDVRLDIAKLRAVKQPAEIEVIQESITVTADVFTAIKAKLDLYTSEKEIMRELTVGFNAVADGHKFDPIVASGKNAATIHYKKNDQAIEQNALLLVDTGAQIGMYGADISRTWSVGEPTARQKEIFEAVLEVHERALSRLKPGVFLREQQRLVNEDLKNQCKKLNLPEKELPSGLSHFLGIDTHDAGDYNAPLEEGMIITVEPGMYLTEEGIGVRIEDDVLITKNGIKNLSEAIPKTL